MPKTIVINGINFTAAFAPTGYTVTPTFKHGSNRFDFLDGTSDEDELAVKDVITLPCMPLSDADQAQFLSLLRQNPYVSVTYYSPTYGTTRTIYAYRSWGVSKYRGEGITGDSYWTGLVVTMEER